VQNCSQLVSDIKGYTRFSAVLVHAVFSRVFAIEISGSTILTTPRSGVGRTETAGAPRRCRRPLGDPDVAARRSGALKAQRTHSQTATASERLAILDNGQTRLKPASTDWILDFSSRGVSRAE